MPCQGLSRYSHFSLWQKVAFLQVFGNLSNSCLLPFSSKRFGSWLVLYRMLMTFNRWRLQGGDLKPFNCAQFEEYFEFINFTSERKAYVHFLCIRSFSESHHMYARLRNNHKIKCRMASNFILVSLSLFLIISFEMKKKNELFQTFGHLCSSLNLCVWF